MKQVGDKLTVVKSDPLEGNEVGPLILKGQVYNLKSIYKCECGQEHYNIGIGSPYNYIRCYSCKKEIPKGDDIQWCHPSRFE